MKRNRLSFTMVLITGAGCGGYQLQLPDVNHPANPQALAAPQRPPSQTLAYARATVAATETTTEQSDHQEHHPSPDKDSQRTVVGDGKVVATVPSANQVVVEHGEIKGFMDAMTMGYRVEPPSLLEGLKFGDRVRFTIDVSKKAIVKIEKLK